MKKLLNILLVGVVASFCSGLFFNPVRAETEVTDQVEMPAYYVQGGWKAYNSNTAGVYNACQLFYPTKNRLTIFDLAVNNFNPEGGSIEANIRANGSLHRPAAILKEYRQVNFNDYTAGSYAMSRLSPIDGQDLTVTPSTGYWICVHWMPTNTNWYYNDPKDGSGSLILGVDNSISFHSTQAFGFRTYGYNVTTQTTPTTTVNSSDSSAPSTNTSTSIAAPTVLAAIFSTASQGVSATWSASKTTDITGYNIYRSTTTGKNYKKVGTVAKNVLQYVDGTVERNVTYYYMVRTYKTTAESANSSEASVTVPADAVIAPAVTSTPSGTVASTSDESSGAILLMTPLTWSLFGLAVLLLGFLVYLICKRHKDSKKQAKKV